MKGVRKKWKRRHWRKWEGRVPLKHWFPLSSTKWQVLVCVCVCVCVCVSTAMSVRASDVCVYIGNSVPSVINDTFYFFTHSIQMYKCISMPCNTCKTKCKKLEINLCPNPRLLSLVLTNDINISISDKRATVRHKHKHKEWNVAIPYAYAYVALWLSCRLCLCLCLCR